ncbi:helix-turn-helix domain-containing protein [Streptomyces sp. MCA2]|uniref:helix-turn-helix domain-containing protein n=1 Tax=Streptomyces sp. MCA2 TaxID=2944805 RepID=UPI0027E44798|nr:helix-turn-helix domain-containing protein [Streptomyces sp. MCA2]
MSDWTGRAVAAARRARLGRPSAMDEDEVRHARALLARREHTVSSIAKLLGVLRNTVYKYVPDLAAG